MKSSKITILAAAPFTKHFGVAVFYKRELIYFAVKTLKSSKVKRQIRREVSNAIGEILREFKPEAVVICKQSKYQMTSDSFATITRQIRREAKLADLPVFWVSFENAKQLVCPEGKQTKARAFESLSMNYPELKQFLNRPNKSQTDYWNPLLTAVAIGYFHQQNNSEQN